VDEVEGAVGGVNRVQTLLTVRYRWSGIHMSFDNFLTIAR
jgi:hypothetical protein